MWKRNAILFCVAMCAWAKTFPEFPVMAASAYPNVVVKSGVSVAAIPVEDEKQQEKYFGALLTWKGYLPVFVVIENHSSESYLLAKQALSYGPSGTAHAGVSDPSKPSKSDDAVNVMRYVPVFGIGLGAWVVASKSHELRQNILKNELQSATLSPGASTHGFVFLPAHWQHSSRNKIDLTIPLTPSGSNEPFAVKLTI